MACTAACLDELEQDGWLVNQTRMWMASQWTVRAGRDWREGEDWLYRNLLDGSRAANRLGWQWTTGAGSGKPYGFSRWQVEKRAPGLCRDCVLRGRARSRTGPTARPGRASSRPTACCAGATDGGPRTVERTGEPEAVWLTAESLGSEDPALLAHPDLPRVFVFDEPLLRRLRLSGRRLVFLAEALAELDVEVLLGDPVVELAGRPLAVTWAPVPGFRRRSAALDVVALHPWPWLRRPGGGVAAVVLGLAEVGRPLGRGASCGVRGGGGRFAGRPVGRGCCVLRRTRRDWPSVRGHAARAPRSEVATRPAPAPR